MSDPAAAPSAGSAGASAFAAATQSLRTTARWLLTAAAGVAAALVAGLQLTSIGSLGADQWPRLLVAVGGVAAALAATSYVILRAAQLLTDEWVTLSQLEWENIERRFLRHPSRRDRRRHESLRKLYEDLPTYGDELYGHLAADVPDLYNQLRDANRAARLTPTAPVSPRATALHEAAGAVTSYANYYLVRDAFIMLRRQLAVAGAVLVAGVLVFAYAANPPKPEAKTGAKTGAKGATVETLSPHVPRRGVALPFAPDIAPDIADDAGCDAVVSGSSVMKSRLGCQDVGHENGGMLYASAVLAAQCGALPVVEELVYCHISVEAQRSRAVLGVRSDLGHAL
ncbi:hypothetical protein A6A06_07685 [Streptomyces sp. CB02923]|uniref:hypothetical protein n=1 Tax=Streptomyces sp. CB02923 TaxID=1718985 RepID=UPI00093ACA74|nr:hypothetical protein [Streptomyces sp. CB02923]OKI04631.1 hypothetical protein A6A06_07685 [Streptomyces sp. CB02923]